MERIANVHRQTSETTVEVGLVLDGTGRSQTATGNGMLDHMLSQLSRHSLFDLTVTAKGDISPGWHHLVEDVGIVLGQALSSAVGEGKGILRMGHVMVPLDETMALVALDIGGRPYAVVNVAFNDPLIGDLPSDLIRHFLEVLALEARMNLHAQILLDGNDHHKAEALFKALARALREALAVDPRVAYEIPSTKGTIRG